MTNHIYAAFDPDDWDVEPRRQVWLMEQMRTPEPVDVDDVDEDYDLDDLDGVQLTVPCRVRIRKSFA